MYYLCRHIFPCDFNVLCIHSLKRFFQQRFCSMLQRMLYIQKKKIKKNIDNTTLHCVHFCLYFYACLFLSNNLHLYYISYLMNFQTPYSLNRNLLCSHLSIKHV